MAGSVQLANGAQCICGNNDAVKFRHYCDRDDDDKHLGSFCLECKREYLKEIFILDDIEKDGANVLKLDREEFYQAERLDTTDSGVHDVHPRKTPIENLDLFGDNLKPGDHIAWQRPYSIWHHALVSDIDVVNGKIRVIHWHGKFKTDARIQEEFIDLKKQSGTLYRMDYEEDILKENPLRLVLARARSRLGDDGYQFFADNCEAFVTYCKKGIEKSQQVVALLKKLHDHVKIVLGCIPAKFVTKGLEIAKATFENAGKVGTAETVENIAKNCQWVGFGLVIIIEGCLTIYDLKKLYDARKDGSLSGNEFMEQVSKRVTEALCAGIPAALGGLVPGVTGIFVGIICGVVGKIVGSLIGPYVGRAITKIIKPNDRAVTSIEDLHLGDHIVFYCTIAHPRHHCIVLWHEEKENKVNVIHNTYKFGVTQEFIKYVPPFYKVTYQEKECQPPEEVCSRALSKLGTNDYNIITYNCKHFAEWCKKS